MSSLCSCRVEPLEGNAARTRLTSALKGGCHAAKMVLFLILCTHIRRLEFSTEYDDGQGLCDNCSDVLLSFYALDFGGSRVITLAELRSVTIIGRRKFRHDDTAPAVLSAFVAAPNVTELRMDGFTSLSNPQSCCVPVTSRLQSLQLLSYYGPNTGLVRSCGSLSSYVAGSTSGTRHG